MTRAEPKTTRITIPLTDDIYRRLLAEQQRQGAGKPSKPSFVLMAYQMWLDRLPKPSRDTESIVRHRIKMRRRRRNGIRRHAGDEQTPQN